MAPAAEESAAKLEDGLLALLAHARKIAADGKADTDGAAAAAKRREELADEASATAQESAGAAIAAHRRRQEQEEKELEFLRNDSAEDVAMIKKLAEQNKLLERRGGLMRTYAQQVETDMEAKKASHDRELSDMNAQIKQLEGVLSGLETEHSRLVKENAVLDEQVQGEEGPTVVAKGGDDTVDNEIEVIDDNSFRIVMKEPTDLALRALSKPTGTAPFMMPKRIADLAIGQPITDMTGSGPFKVIEFKPGVNRLSLGLDGTETYDVTGARTPRATLTLVIHRRSGERVEVPVICRLDTAEEVSIYEAGGVLQRFAQDFLASSKVAA